MVRAIDYPIVRVGLWRPRRRCVACLSALDYHALYDSLGVCPHCGNSSLGGNTVETVQDTVRNVREELRPWWAWWRGPRFRVSLEEATYSNIGDVHNLDGELLGHLDVMVRGGSYAFFWPSRSRSTDGDRLFTHHRIERSGDRWICPPESVESLAGRRMWTPAEGTAALPPAASVLTPDP
jgi:hypothetical protein